MVVVSCGQPTILVFRKHWIPPPPVFSNKIQLLIAGIQTPVNTPSA